MSCLTNIGSIKSFLDDSDIRISFFGSRIVYLPTTKESIRLDSLASKVEELAERKKYSITPEEKQMCNAISEKAWVLYRKSDDLLEKARWITKIFEQIQEFLRPKGWTIEDYITQIPTFED